MKVLLPDDTALELDEGASGEEAARATLAACTSPCRQATRT